MVTSVSEESVRFPSLNIPEDLNLEQNAYLEEGNGKFPRHVERREEQKPRMGQCES
jgi:hypothetical protein